MTPTEIRDAITNSVELSVLVSQGNIQAIAEALSVGRITLGVITAGKFQSWCASTGMRAIIEDAANNTQHPLRSIALTLKDVLQGGNDQIDLTYPGNLEMLDAWVAIGALTEQNKAALISLGMVSDPVTIYQVKAALDGAQ